MNERLTKADLALLRRAFEAEINAALRKHPAALLQTRSKRALSLVARSYLVPAKVVLPGRFAVTVAGFQLTHLGRLAYCAACSRAPPDE